MLNCTALLLSILRRKCAAIGTTAFALCCFPPFREGALVWTEECPHGRGLSITCIAHQLYHKAFAPRGRQRCPRRRGCLVLTGQRKTHCWAITYRSLPQNATAQQRILYTKCHCVACVFRKVTLYFDGITCCRPCSSFGCSGEGSAPCSSAGVLRLSRRSGAASTSERRHFTGLKTKTTLLSTPGGPRAVKKGAHFRRDRSLFAPRSHRSLFAPQDFAGVPTPFLACFAWCLRCALASSDQTPAAAGSRFHGSIAVAVTL